MSEQYDNIDNIDNAEIKQIIAQESKKTSSLDLNTFLQKNSQYVTEKGDPNTNIINRINGSTYNFPPNIIETFFCKLNNARKENTPLHFQERQDKEHSGIMIDFDRNQISKQSEFNNIMFQNLSCHLTQILVEILDITNDMTDQDGRFPINIFYIQKPKPVVKVVEDGKNIYRDGFHILIPHIMVSRAVKQYLIREIKKRNVFNTVFDQLKCLNDSHDDDLDMASSHVPIMFYGCSKPEKSHQSYQLVCAHNVSTSPNGGFPFLTMLPFDGYERDPDINLCYELSVSFDLQDTEDFTPHFKRYKLLPKFSLMGEINANVEQHGGDIISEDELLGNRDDISIIAIDDPDARYIKMALDILTPDYASNYDKWFKVIVAIANCNPRYKPFAKHFSMRCPEKYTESGFENIWNRAISGEYKGEQLSRRSIHYWAKTCSPTQHREIFNNGYYKQLRKYVYKFRGRIEDGMVADVLHRMLEDKFVTDIKSNELTERHHWYEFVTRDQSQTHGEIFKWREEGDPGVLHRYIQSQLSKIYEFVNNDIKQRLDETENDEERKYLKRTADTFLDSTCKLYKQSYRDSIIKSAQYLFRVRGFCRDLDQEPDIIGVGNGVLKLGKTAELIQGFHEYRISMHTDTDYIPYDENNPYIANILKIISQIYYEKDVQQYVMMFLSMGLDGHPSAPLMLFLGGAGANGKTTLLEMARNCLGEYGYKPPMNLLTDKREQGSSANSAFIGMKQKRLNTYSEADDDKGEIFVNGGRFKEMISPEIQTGRELHKKQENFKITATQVAALNKRLSFRSNDHAIWRRVRYYKHKVKFCSNPDPNNPFEVKENSEIAEKYPHDPNYKSAMLSILTHYNERLRSEYNGDIKRVSCPTIDIETEEYRNTQDTLNQFITQMIVEPNGPPIEEDDMKNNEFEYSLGTIISKYKSWYEHTKGRQLGDCSIEVIENSRIGGLLTTSLNGIDKTFRGYRIRESVDEKLRNGEKFLINMVKEGQKDQRVPEENQEILNLRNEIDRLRNVRHNDVDDLLDEI